jgi:hypothetical protein
MGEEQNSAFFLVLAGYLFVLLIDPEDGGSMLFRNTGEMLPDHMTLHSRRSYSFCYRDIFKMITATAIMSFGTTWKQAFL